MTSLINKFTDWALNYHKTARMFPKFHGHLKSMNKLTLRASKNEKTQDCSNDCAAFWPVALLVKHTHHVTYRSISFQQ